jgi:outer membrane immunogenic protein
MAHSSAPFTDGGQSGSPSFFSIYRAANSFDAAGAIAGAHAGYLWQVGGLAFGPELDLDVSTVASAKPTGVGFTSFCPSCFGTTVFQGNFTGEYKLAAHWLATARMRAGVALDQWFFFGGGGVALGGFEFRSGISSFSTSDVAVGYALGGGVEYGWSSNVALRLEYLRYQFPDMKLTQSSPGTALTANVERSLDVIRGGIDWRL